ncbi:urea amidolyase associated protein UAAP1 [Peribacillus simplex]|uniref:Urea carboxylase-associated protein 2 n=1 Tax=Peribacillus simplex TaxID=1478 RepID=A0AAN2PFH6_9BACI|nr:urea amidolyase associated protein UAAP1 [Peribacillus simplex]CEG31584.1 urea carboxylase-associated protein 2 [Peribacillus simplex]
MNGINTTIVSKMISPGGKWSSRIKRGKQITFTAMENGANVSLLLYNADDTAERYNMPDTLKAQYTAYLTKGNVLLSDNGRVLASITEDSIGWHDTISGYCTRQQIDQKYGETTYQELRNDWYQNGEGNLIVELFRNGLTTSDLSPVVNLFSKVSCDDEGNTQFVQGHTKKGDKVTLRTEMDVLLVLSNTPNPLDTNKTYTTAPIEITITDAEPVKEDDVCLNHRPENRRAFENTWEYLLLSKGGIQ